MYFYTMRYHFIKPEVYGHMYGETYDPGHPIYRSATLYFENGKGVCVIQQRFDFDSKSTYWTAIDESLADILYTTKGFYEFFKASASEMDLHGYFPTVTLRKLMWSLRMKPLKREPWETYFTRKFV